MCKATVKDANPRLLLISVDSFCENKNTLPNKAALAVTISFMIAMLILSEMTFRQIIDSMKDWHPVLEDDTNRLILARHVGVDSMACFIVTYLGFKARHVMKELTDVVFGRTPAMTKAYENRMFKYQPEAARISLFFLSYQLKNMYDTIVWDDGALFIAHHVLTLGTIYGALWPGAAQFYAPFYFGISEFSTGVLCLLANFDDEHGAVGLADAFPMAKAVLGGFFAFTFIMCRVVMWCTVSYYFVPDAWNAIKGTKDPKFAGHIPWCKFYMVSLSLLSVLQVIWLGEIFRVGYVEMKSMGIL